MTVLSLLSPCSCKLQARFEALLHQARGFRGQISCLSSWDLRQDAHGFHELFHVLLTHLLALQLGIAPICPNCQLTQTIKLGQGACCAANICSVLQGPACP